MLFDANSLFDFCLVSERLEDIAVYGISHVLV